MARASHLLVSPVHWIQVLGGIVLSVVMASGGAFGAGDPPIVGDEKEPPVPGDSDSGGRWTFRELGGEQRDRALLSARENAIRGELDEYVDINGAPIHIWILSDETGVPQKVRVTGHATECYCHLASKILGETLYQSQSLEGFLHFGVGELRASQNGGTRELAAMLKRLRDQLASGKCLGDWNKWVVFHTVDQDFDRGVEGANAPPASLPGRVALLGNQHYGPAFFMVRTFQSAQPLTIDLSLSELMLDAALFARLSGNVGVAPYAETVAVLDGRLANVNRLIDLRRKRHVFNDHVWKFNVRHYTWRGRGSVNPAMLRSQVASADARLKREKEKFEVARLVFQYISLEVSTATAAIDENIQHVEGKLREIEERLAINTACRELPLRCREYYDVEMIKGDGGLIEQLLDRFTERPEKELLEVRSRIQQDLAVAQRELREAEEMGASRRASLARSALVDGLLRGWPIPTTTQADARRIEKYLKTTVPVVWEKVLRRMADLGGPDLREVGRIGGLLNRGDLFFQVVEHSPGRFSITPTYAVHGNYAEVWDPQRGVVTIESPYGFGDPGGIQQMFDLAVSQED